MRSAIKTLKQNGFHKKDCRNWIISMYPMACHKYIDTLILEVYGK